MKYEELKKGLGILSFVCFIGFLTIFYLIASGSETHFDNQQKIITNQQIIDQKIDDLFANEMYEPFESNCSDPNTHCINMTFCDDHTSTIK